MFIIFSFLTIFTTNIFSQNPDNLLNKTYLQETVKILKNTNNTDLDKIRRLQVLTSSKENIYETPKEIWDVLKNIIIEKKYSRKLKFALIDFIKSRKNKPEYFIKTLINNSDEDLDFFKIALKFDDRTTDDNQHFKFVYDCINNQELLFRYLNSPFPYENKLAIEALANIKLWTPELFIKTISANEGYEQNKYLLALLKNKMANKKIEDIIDNYEIPENLWQVVLNKLQEKSYRTLILLDFIKNSKKNQNQDTYEKRQGNLIATALLHYSDLVNIKNQKDRELIEKINTKILNINISSDNRAIIDMVLKMLIFVYSDMKIITSYQHLSFLKEYMPKLREKTYFDSRNPFDNTLFLEKALLSLQKWCI